MRPAGLYSNVLAVRASTIVPFAGLERASDENPPLFTCRQFNLDFRLRWSVAVFQENNFGYRTGGGTRLQSQSSAGAICRIGDNQRHRGPADIAAVRRIRSVWS